MKLPRDVSGADLAKALRRLGYERRASAALISALRAQQAGEHHEAIPHHHPLKPGLLSTTLKSVSAHHRLSLPELLAIPDLQQGKGSAPGSYLLFALVAVVSVFAHRSRDLLLTLCSG